MEKIAKIGFHVSLISYGFFWLMDILRPGFVSRSFSVHLFLVSTLIFGLWWGFSVKEYTDRPWLQRSLAIAFGIFLCVLTWNLGEAFGGLRLIICLIALLAPTVFIRLVRS